MELIYKSWDNMPIKTWKELNEVQSDNELTVLVERMAILCDCDPQDIRNLDMRDFNKLSEGLSFLSGDLPSEVNLKIEIDGKWYGMIPNLNYISSGEFIDIENFKKDSIKNIHYIAATLWRPIVKEDDLGYLIQNHQPRGFEERANLFLKKMPITNIWGGILFFSSFAIQFLEITQDYLEKENLKPETKITQKPTRKNKPKSSPKGSPGMTSSRKRPKTTRSK
jgi:hypothetical protein